MEKNKLSKYPSEKLTQNRLRRIRQNVKCLTGIQYCGEYTLILENYLTVVGQK